MSIRLAAPLALVAFSCSSLALAGAPDAAPSERQAEQAEQSAATEARPDKQRKVCRNETATGSVMPRRRCRTVAQMEEEERNAERFRDQQNRMGAQAR